MVFYTENKLGFVAVDLILGRDCLSVSRIFKHLSPQHSGDGLEGRRFAMHLFGPNLRPHFNQSFIQEKQIVASR